MKIYILPLTALFILPHPGFAASLAEPEINTCTHAEGITKCEVKCVRSLGEQCLVTHVNFAGENLKSGKELWRAKFQTCKNANVDLQIKSLVLALENTDKTGGKGSIEASTAASGKTVITRSDRNLVFAEGQSEGYLARIPFEGFLDSGKSHMEASFKINQCGRPDNTNTCRVSGKFVAVTDPNVRCDFHDTTQSGAFRPPSLQISPSLQNSQRPVGQIGE